MQRKRKLLKKTKAKAQSAMEYLMTYGWAILIIAVVLGALYQLGVFSPYTFAPKAPPGSCQVFRPNGPGTTQFVSLQGVCSGEMPQYVAQFNGQSGYINTPLKFPPSTSQVNFTVVAWVNINGNCKANSFYCGIIDGDNGNQGWGLMAGTGGVDFWILASVSGTVQDMVFGVPIHNWNFIAINYSYVSGNYIANGFVNGALVDANVKRSPISLPEPYSLQIGMARGTADMIFNGSVADIQIYNTSLSANEIQALYQEGIGGAPIDLQNLVGWWPLNGNANDYSGNGNNAVPNGVTYTSSWTSSYTAP